ncbi:MAG: PSP1 C-terminal domain-containing protein [Bacteroidales bacterium]|jgi:cell fate regulator YaaT (PSP1 superfamily)|nr:PSP1 C-terminal domain-containing protein [Bacteroidales bacterium]
MCAGECTCGKSGQTAVNKGIYLTPLSIDNGALTSPDWNRGAVNLSIDAEIILVRFKNNRKEFYKNSRMLDISHDMRVVVAAGEGHDIGTVTFSGEKANELFEKEEAGKSKSSLENIQRIADKFDLNTWLDSRKQDRNFLQISRQLAESFNMDIYIYDIEVRGDGKKTTLFYTSERKLDLKEFQDLCISSFKMKTELHHSYARLEISSSKEEAACC